MATEPEEDLEEVEEIVKKVEPAKDSIIAKLKAADKNENKTKVYHVDKELHIGSYTVIILEINFNRIKLIVFIFKGVRRLQRNS